MNDFETNRRSTFSKRVSLGGIALILAGLTLIPQGILTANVPSSPQQNLEMAAGANSFNYRLGMTLAGISLALFLLGVFALYAHLSQTKQERVAFAGLIVTVGFLGLFLPLIGFAAYVVPAIGSLVEQGRVEMVAVMEQIFVEPFIVVPFLAGILWNIGNILMGIAIWRSGTQWKWGGLLVIHYGVVGITAFLDVKVFQILATPLGGLALMAVGVSLRRSAAIGK
jgi:hypothetical protein